MEKTILPIVTAHGGLKMIDYSAFITALKSSWIKRLINSNAKWVNLLETTLEIEISNLWKRGLDFTSEIIRKIPNLFWKEVLLSWAKVVKSTSNQNEKQFNNELLWDNPNIQIGNSSVFLKNYFRAGFTLISDLFDCHGNFLSLELLNNMKVNTSFIEYAGLKKAIKNT